MSGVSKKIVLPDEAGMRLDRWFKTHFPTIRHGELEKLLRKGQVRVSGTRAKSNRRLEPGEEIRIPPMRNDASMSKPTKPYREDEAEALKDIILYEDESLIALNKPFGLAVQGGTNTKRHVDGMLASFGARNDERPKLVHRLDKDTGGLLIVAKSRIAAQCLGDAFKSHQVEKIYWALTAGVPRPRQGTITMPVAKRMVRIGDNDMERVIAADGADAKPAITDYQTIDEAGHGVAFLAMRPVTGRTHQLRVHAAAIECPIIGDGKYGGHKARLAGVSPKLHLFCRSMSFPHPKTRKIMTLMAPLTGHMEDTWRFFAFDGEAVSEWPEDLR